MPPTPDTTEALAENLSWQARNSGGDPIKLYVDRADLLLILAALRSQPPARIERPFPYIMHEYGHRIELWLMTKENGTLKPYGSTGPVSLPSAWEAEYRASLAGTSGGRT